MRLNLNKLHIKFELKIRVEFTEEINNLVPTLHFCLIKMLHQILPF